MIDETTAADAVEAVTEEVKATAAKAAPKKTTARKPAAKKVVAKKATAAKKEAKKSFDSYFSTSTLKESREKLKESADKVSDLVKSVAYAQLGVYGKLYDEVSSRVEARRKQAPKQWNELIKRGEKVQKDLEKSQADIKERIQSIDVKAELKGGVDKVKESYSEGFEKVKDSYKETFEKVKGFAKKAA